jgi:chemotaxis protein MotB
MSSAWKVAYADFVTAMMAFFLLMWILNMVPPETKKGLAAYFTGEGTFESSNVSQVSNNPFIQNTDKLDTRDIKMSETEKANYAIARKLKQMLMADAPKQSAEGISADDVGVLLRVNSDAMFAPGTATLMPAAEKILDQVVGLLREYNLYLVVRGHADEYEVTDASAYPSKWELSGARAAAAVRFVADNGKIKPTRLRAVAYADTRPLEPGTTPEGAAKNRRVEFYFHRPDIMSYSVVY